MPRVLTRALLILQCVVAIGCSRSAPRPPPAKARAAAAEKLAEARDSTERFTGTLVTEGEYYDAARAFEADAERLDAGAMDRVLDMAPIATKALDELGADPTLTQGIVRKIAAEGVPGGGFTGAIVRSLEANGSYRLLRVLKRRGQHTATFRLQADTGLNYHELILSKRASGEIVIRDVYTMMTGEPLSATLRRSLLPVVADHKRNALQKRFGAENDVMANLSTIKAMQLALVEQDGEGMLRSYHKLPKSLQEDKTYLLIRLMAASMADNAVELKAAIESYARLFPGDASLDLVTLDKLIMDKKFDEAQAAVDRIDQAVGGDPYLNLMRGTIALQAGNREEAKRLIQLSMHDPEADSNRYFTKIAIALEDHDFDETLKQLVAVEKRFQLQLSDLTDVDDYAEFVKSPQYQTWLEREQQATADD